MYVGIVVLELHLPYCRDLKSKRRIVHGLIDRLRERYRVSIVETGHQDLHQRAELGCAFVGSSLDATERTLEVLRRSVEETEGAMLTTWNPEILEEHS